MRDGQFVLFLLWKKNTGLQPQTKNRIYLLIEFISVLHYLLIHSSEVKRLLLDEMTQQ